MIEHSMSLRRFRVSAIQRHITVSGRISSAEGQGRVRSQLAARTPQLRGMRTPYFFSSSFLIDAGLADLKASWQKPLKW